MDKRKLWANVAFGVVVLGVVGTFVVLGLQARPPAMPGGPQHQLRFNLKGQLIGLETDPPVDPLRATTDAGFSYDLKAVERRINSTCQACHGAPGEDLSQHGCAQLGGCIPPHHPPKTECIKCHRGQAPSPAAK